MTNERGTAPLSAFADRNVEVLGGEWLRSATVQARTRGLPSRHRPFRFPSIPPYPHPKRSVASRHPTPFTKLRQILMAPSLLARIQRLGSRSRRLLKKDRFGDALMTHLKRTATNCVLDVGANHGQYGKYLRTRGYDGLIVSFEPVESSYEILRRHTAGDRRWRVFRMALGETEGEVPINILPRSDFNSFRRPNSFALANIDGIEPHSTEIVPVRRLADVMDECAAGVGSPSIFLKTDTQGFDLEVLRGLGHRRAEIHGVQAEIPVTPIYSGVAGCVDTLTAYAELGFEPFGFRPISWSDGALLEMDGLFRRARG